ncbi:MAG: YebC/PmpR family DNA-binding transcriptional regulator, partial [Gammaproteobacteria bacterium]|nr:YebC/PmpR family DNA-binding transcriptional regulator [Gammaproteobacteria bacterium]
IDRAIKRGAGASEGENYEELVYEGYGPNGVAVIVETMTDNHKRTVADVRHAFTKAGGSLGTNGSVAYLFTRRGVLLFAPGVNEEALMEAALDAGADDVVAHDDGSFEVFAAPEQFNDVKDALLAAGLAPDSSEVTLVPSTRAEVDADHVSAFFKMLDQLEDSDDVQNVYHNAEISDELMAEHG